MESAVVWTTVMKGVADALKLDGDGNKPKEAYMKYLECILRITTKLLQNVRSDNGQVHITKEVVRFVHLGNQCMERIVAIVNQFSSSSSDNLGNTETTVSQPQESKSAPSTPVSNQPQTLSSHDNRYRLSSAPMSLPPACTQSKPKVLTPSEIAMMKNHQLMLAYKTRIGGLGTRKSAAASLSLTLQRKMAENLAIAKAQEEALEKKIKERQQRLEEQAARKFSGADGTSENEEQKKEIYKKVLEYEQDTSWLLDLKRKLEENPEDAGLIQQLILGILKCGDHPLTQQLKLYQYKIYEKIHPLVSKEIEHLSEIKVPLSPRLFPPGVATSWSGDSDGVGEENDNEVYSSDTDEEDNDVVDVFDKELKSSVEDENQHKETTVDDEVCNTEEKAEDGEKKLDVISEDVKEDLTEAIEKGENLKTKLEQENKKVNRIIRQLSSDLEKYSIENMDDLFDDDDNNDEGEEEKWMPPPYSSLQTEDKNKQISDQSEGKRLDNNQSDTHDEAKNDQVNNDTEKLDQSKGSSDMRDVGKSEKNSELSPKRRHSSSSKLAQKPKVEYIQAMNTKVKEMKNEAYHRHLNGISQDVQIYWEKLQGLFVMMYEQLESPAGQDQCYACLEKPFFQPVWQYLVALFRLANEPKEVAVAYVMTRYQHSTPKDFNVSRKLRLDRDQSCDKISDFPYHPAVMELQAITTRCTLLDKLECLVRSSRLICQCIEDYYKDQESIGPSVGADDLLPILCYVIVKAAQPQIVSECHIMEEFIHEGYIMGEEGYCLTSLQTALAYLTSLGMEDQS